MATSEYLGQSLGQLTSHDLFLTFSDIFPVSPGETNIGLIVDSFITWCYCCSDTLHTCSLLAGGPALSSLKIFHNIECRLYTILTLALHRATRAPMGMHMMVEAARTRPVQCAQAG